MLTLTAKTCIYQGLIAIPDVSCMTSFSSKIIKSHDDLAKSLAVSASVEGGGWGVSFSASADYQHSVHTISDGEYVSKCIRIANKVR